MRSLALPGSRGPGTQLRPLCLGPAGFPLARETQDARKRSGEVLGAAGPVLLRRGRPHSCFFETGPVGCLAENPGVQALLPSVPEEEGFLEERCVLEGWWCCREGSDGQPH
ncbi:hypothetical protein E2320_013683, partial [Naja naja]